MLSRVELEKTRGNLAIAPVTPWGLAIIAPSLAGPLTPESVGNTADSDTLYGKHSPLAESAAYAIGRGVNVVCVRAECTGAAAPATTGKNAAGTGPATGTADVDLGGFATNVFRIVVRVVEGGTTGTAGIVLRFSIDGGATWLADAAMGTGTAKPIEGTGLSVELGVGTLVTGETYTATSSAPTSTLAQIESAFDRLLENKSLPFVRVCVVGFDVDPSAIAVFAQQTERFAPSKRPEVFCSTRSRARSGETEGAYKAALTAIAGTTRSPEVALSPGQALSLIHI